MKLCYIDLETGGIDPVNCALLQIAGIIEIDGVEKERFEFFLHPYPDDIVTEEALEKTGILLEDLENNPKFRNPGIVYKDFLALLDKYVSKFDKKDKFFLVGYNSHAFDFQFLINFFIKNNNNFFMSYFWYPSIDVMLLAAFSYMDERAKFNNFKLTTVAEVILGKENVDESKAHDAMYDIELTRNIYKAFNL